MNSAYERALAHLRIHPKKWLVTGAAGFIGSHLLEALLRLDQRVVGLDNFSTGNPANLEAVRSLVSGPQWERFEFQQGSILDQAACQQALDGVDCLLHQAGFVSAPLSLRDPADCLQTNVVGTHNLLLGAQAAAVERVVYASSSAVYGDDPCPEKIESELGQPLSPYATSKRVAEMYAALFGRQSELRCVGLRYFNVFGPRQDPTGGYAAVIPQWLHQMALGQACQIHGDGRASRDFCHVANVVQANLLAATAEIEHSEVFNVGLGQSTSIAELYRLLASEFSQLTGREPIAPVFGPARVGDMEHSKANVAKITAALGFEPKIQMDQGLKQTVRWYTDAQTGAVPFTGGAQSAHGN